MNTENLYTRRVAVKSSVFGLLAASIPNIGYSGHQRLFHDNKLNEAELFHRYPSIDDAIVAEVVGASHFNLDSIKALVNQRPELARATWDWAFGDWETALGAASHVGRRDIASFLMEKGARPDIFTYAMFGAYEAVKEMIESIPGVQSIQGPHGFSLLHHARVGLRSKELSDVQIENSNKLISYLEELGDADPQVKQIEIAPNEQDKYMGDYYYGDGPEDGFTVKLNMRKMLSLGKLGKGGGSLYQKAPNVFSYNGTSSVEIVFDLVDGAAISLTVIEPDLKLVAIKKVS